MSAIRSSTSKSIREKITATKVDDEILRERRSSCYKTGTDLVLVISHKSKIKLVKEVQAKESRGWECAEPIKEQGGHYVAKMTFKQR